VASLSAVPSDERAFSEEHLYALNRAPIGTNQFASGQFIFGSKLTSPTIDLRTEGIVVSVNGKSVAAGVAWDLMGDPVNVVVATANHLAKYGECLRAGQLLVTGTPVWPPRVVPGETHTVRAEFTRLGSVSARFAS
jgi:2-keto-4-pentenoate hydratase